MPNYQRIGAKRYAVRREGDAVHPRTLPYIKALTGGTDEPAGVPMYLVSGSTGGNVVAVPTTVSGIYMTGDRILGFLSEPDFAVASAAYGNVGIPVGIPFTYGNFGQGSAEQRQVNIADDMNVFSMAVAASITVQQSMVGQDFGLILESDGAGNTWWVLSNGAVPNKIFSCVSVRPEDVGVEGGQIDFMVKEANRQWPTAS